MIANDDLAYKTHHIVGAHISLLFTMLHRITLESSIQIHVNERVGCMERMSIIVTNMCCVGHLGFLFTNSPLRQPALPQ